MPHVACRPGISATRTLGTGGFFRAELTEAIRGSDDPDSVAILGPVADRSTVSERVRHWVRLGLLSAIGGRYPGVGRHRSFALDAILPATLLNYLADEGIQIREGTRHALDQAAEAYEDWKAHFGEGVCYWMRLGSPRGEHVAPTYWYKSTRPTRMTASPVRVEINLSTIFDRLLIDENQATRLCRELTGEWLEQRGKYLK